MSYPDSDGSRSRGARWNNSIRVLFLLLLCFYSCMLAIQHRAWVVASAKVGTQAGMLSSPLMNESQSTSTQMLREILSKYDVDLSYPVQKVKIADANRSIAFVHIGKTGGSTISMHIRNGCREMYMVPCLSRKDGWTPNETAASYRIESYFHMEDIPSHKLDHFTTVVTTVRDPISRFLSAFAYGHPTNSHVTKSELKMEEKQRYSCFPSISYLVKAAMGRAEIPWNKAHMMKIRAAAVGTQLRTTKSNEMAPINCTESAFLAFGLNESWAIVNGSHPWLNHMSFDYRQYYRSMLPDKEIIAIRYNQLHTDWVRVNEILSHEYDPSKVWPDVPPFRDIHRNVSSGYAVKDRWKIQTSREQLWICQLLREEIRTYFLIIMRAVNLDERDLLKAVLDIDNKCSVQANFKGSNSTER